MILATSHAQKGTLCKPRASGDDPTLRRAFLDPSGVNPARAGMILCTSS